MSLYCRGEVWHYDFTRDGQRVRGSTGLRDKKAARAFEDRERQRVALGGSPGQSLALQDVGAVWFAARVAHRRSEADTARRFKTVLRLLGPRTPVTSIGAPEVAAAIAARRSEITRQSRKAAVKRAPTNATINRDLIDSTLRPLLNYARRVLRLPVREIEWAQLRLPEPKERVRAFSRAELTAFRAALPHWHRPVFDFIARYGVRLEEAFFPLAALDLDAGRLTLRARKGGDEHTLPLLDDDTRAMAAMAGRATAAGLPTLWIREMKDGELRAIDPRGFQSACGRAVVTAGLTDARAVHDLRHTAGTDMLRATGNLQLVRKLLGHADIRSTARYAHASDDDLLEGLRHASATTGQGPKKKAS